VKRMKTKRGCRETGGTDCFHWKRINLPLRNQDWETAKQYGGENKNKKKKIKGKGKKRPKLDLRAKG